MSGSGGVDRVVDEARLDPAWAHVRSRAIEQALASHLAAGRGAALEEATLAVVEAQLLHDRGVDSVGERAAWMTARGLDERAVRALVLGEALRLWGVEHAAALYERAVRLQLAMHPDYPRWAARAAHKTAALEAGGLLDLDRAVDVGFQQFSTWCRENLPHLDPAAIAARTEDDPFPDPVARQRVLLNEYHYVTRCMGTAGSGGSEPGAVVRDDDIVVTERTADGARLPASGLLGDLEAFFAASWDRAALLLQGQAVSLARAVDLPVVDAILGSRHADARILDRGVHEDPGAYRLATSGRPDGRAWVSEPAPLLAAPRRGLSVMVADVHELCPPIASYARRLEDELGAAVTPTLFVSPHGATTDWHADDTHGVIVQLHGSKRWMVSGDRPAADPAERRVVELDLAGGDVLYVPNQFPHKVRCTSPVSVHVTFCCAAPTWGDAAKEAVGRAFDHAAGVRLRAGSSRSRRGADDAAWIASAEAAIAGLERAVGLLRAHPEALVAAPRRRVPPSHEGALLRTHDALSLTPESVVRACPGLPVDVRDTGGRIELVLADRVVSLPGPARPAVAALFGTPAAAPPAVRVGSLGLDAGDALTVVRRLVVEGVLEGVLGSVHEAGPAAAPDGVLDAGTPCR